MTCFVRKNKELICSLVLNIFVVYIALHFGLLQFGTNDDRDVSNLLAGVYGGDNGQYIVFINIILCKALSFLYKATNNIVNWYVLLSLVLSGLSLVALSYILMARAPMFGLGIGLAFVLVCTLYDSHYIVFQFTHNAVLLCITGIILLTDCLWHEWTRKSKYEVTIGILLTIVGSMIRFQAVYFSFPYLIILLGYDFIAAMRSKNKLIAEALVYIRSKKKSLLGIFLMVVLVIAARGIHIHKYLTNPVLKDFYEENLLRAELLDYGVPSYEEHAAEYESIGLSQADVELFTEQCFWDKNIFSKDILEAMVAMKTEVATAYSIPTVTKEKLAETFASITDSLQNSAHWFVVIGVLFFLVIFTGKRRVIAMFAMFGSLLFTLGVNYYFVSTGRMPYRVWYAFMTPLVVFGLYLCVTGGEREALQNLQKAQSVYVREIKKKLVYGILIVLVEASIYKVIPKILENDESFITNTYELILEYAEQHPDQLVLLDRPTISVLTYTSTIHPLMVPSRESHNNICYLGGWICWTPANMSTLSRFDAVDLLQAIEQGLEVILIDAKTPWQKIDFLRRHYNSNFNLELIDIVDGTEIGMYRIYLENE